MEQLKWETKKVKVKDLIQLDINPRKISEDKKQKLVESLEKFNLVEIPAVNTDLQIIGGNQRVTALLLVGRGEEEIDVRFPNRKLTKKEVKEYAIISNTHAGEFDFEILDLEFADISIGELGFEIEGWDDWKNKQDTLLAGEAQEDDFDVPEGGIETDIVIGDLFEIGEHRLLCGDSTDSDAVAKLMNGEKADCVITDPPYNVALGNETVEQAKKRNRRTDGLTIKNDKMSDSDFLDFLTNYFTTTYLNTKKGGSIYVFFADMELRNFVNAFLDGGFKLSQQLIWKKSSLVMGRKDYQSMHEPILYGWKEGEAHNWYSDRKQTTILEFDKPSRNGEHPTMKPIAIIEYLINNSTKQKELNYDGFLGSGSTMVASHQLKRKCYGMELDPKYCEVIVTRMIKLDNTLTIKRNGIDETQKWLDKLA